MPKLVHMHPEREEREALEAAQDARRASANCVNGNASPAPECDCGKCELISQDPTKRVMALELWKVLELANALDVEIGKAFARQVAERDPQKKHAMEQRTKRLQELSADLHSQFAP